MNDLKDYIVSWVDIYGREHKNHVRAPNHQYAEKAIPSGDILKHITAVEEAVWDENAPYQKGSVSKGTHNLEKWVPKPKPYAHSKVPVYEGPNVDFIEYGSEAMYPYDDAIFDNFDAAYKAAIQLLQSHPNVAILKEDEDNFVVGEMKSAQKTAQLQEDTNALVFFKNYDYGDGPDEKLGPGKGLYSGPMDKFKSVKDFLKKKRKKKKNNKRIKMALILAATCPDAVAGRKYKSDSNDLQDPYEGRPGQPSEALPFPYNPAEYAPLGIYDGITPKEDLEDKPISNLYFGVMEQHDFSADDDEIDDKKEDQ
jgi:hypothetical protein